MSQESVANTMGLTFQQLQKYEHGTNRISSSRLYQLALILGVDVAYFFETVDVDTAVAAAGSETLGADALPAEIMTWRRTAVIVRTYYAIADDAMRKTALDLLKSLGSQRASPLES
jgi:transcriptional regulator with XRE-family HTH domain